MKVSSINLFSWMASLAITGALGYYVYQSYGHLQSPTPYSSQEDEEGRKRAINALTVKTASVQQGPSTANYAGQVVPNFVDFDWTGKPDPVVVPKDDTPVIVEKPKVKIEEILHAYYFQYDTTDPGGSRVMVNYLGELATYGSAELRVADTLPSPHDGIAVVAITTESIEFSFSDEERENEVYEPGKLGSDVIFVVPEGQAAMEQKWQEVIGPENAQIDTRPKNTAVVAKGVYQIGTDDSQYLSDNYQTILSQEVRTRTRRGANGEPAGVEIMEVAQGSFAQRHGVVRGDIVISINGHPVNSKQEAIQWAKDNGDGISVFEVIVERYGRIETLTYRKPDQD